MFRTSNWEDPLATYLDARQDWAFKWGEHDCALFAAGAVKAQTGEDPAAAFRGKYTDARGAAQALRDHGAGTLLKEVRSWFPEHESVHLAKRGDIVMLNALTVGVCVGQFSYFVGEEGGEDRLLCVPTASCAYAFQVPFEPEATDE